MSDGRERAFLEAEMGLLHEYGLHRVISQLAEHRAFRQRVVEALAADLSPPRTGDIGREFDYHTRSLALDMGVWPEVEARLAKLRNSE